MKYTYHDTDRVTREMTHRQMMSLRAMAFVAKMKASDEASIAKALKQPREFVAMKARYARQHAAVAAALEAAIQSGNYPPIGKAAKAKPAAAGYKKRAAKNRPAKVGKS